MSEILTDTNYLLYCAKHYDNPQCYDEEEFFEDMRRVKYIKKLITRFTFGGELRERLILNHLIILSNVFPPPHLVKILFLKLEKQMRYLKPFLIYLSLMPDMVTGIKDKNYTIDTISIDMDQKVIEVLRKL